MGVVTEGGFEPGSPEMYFSTLALLQTGVLSYFQKMFSSLGSNL